MPQRHRFGAWGEDLALALLERCGYQCLERRYRRAGGEIDLILRRGGLVVFVEVKTRGTGALADPAAWVDGRKLRRMRRLARRWLNENPGRAPAGCRFDVVAVHWRGADGGLDLQHLAGVT